MNQAEKDFKEAERLLTTLSPKQAEKAKELIKNIEEYLKVYPEMTTLVLAYIGTKLTLFLETEEKNGSSN